jgi:hypothetical protein
MYNEFCKELSGTYGLVEMNDECHFLTIQKLTLGHTTFRLVNSYLDIHPRPSYMAVIQLPTHHSSCG